MVSAARFGVCAVWCLSGQHRGVRDSSIRILLSESVNFLKVQNNCARNRSITFATFARFPNKFTNSRNDRSCLGGTVRSPGHACDRCCSSPSEAATQALLGSRFELSARSTTAATQIENPKRTTPSFRAKSASEESPSFFQRGRRCARRDSPQTSLRTTLVLRAALSARFGSRPDSDCRGRNRVLEKYR